MFRWTTDYQNSRSTDSVGYSPLIDIIGVIEGLCLIDSICFLSWNPINLYKIYVINGNKTNPGRCPEKYFRTPRTVSYLYQTDFPSSILITYLLHLRVNVLIKRTNQFSNKFWRYRYFYFVPSSKFSASISSDYYVSVCSSQYWSRTITRCTDIPLTIIDFPIVENLHQIKRRLNSIYERFQYLLKYH